MSTDTCSRENRMYSAASRARRRFRALSCILAIAVLAATTMGPPVQAVTAPSVAEGMPLPPITLSDWNGNPVEVRPTPGRGLYLVSWRWWSPNLRLRLHALATLSEEYRALGVDIIAVHHGRCARAAAWFHHMDFGLETLWDCDGSFIMGLMERFYGSIGVDTKGIVRVFHSARATPAIASSASAPTELLREFREDLDRLISRPAPTADTRDRDRRLNLPKVGMLAPEFVLPDFEGNLFSTASLRGNSPAAYVFWASPYALALSTLYRLRELAPEFRARGVEFVSINTMEDVASARRWLRSNPLPFIHLRDEFLSATARYGIWGVPTLVVVDRDGVVTFSGVGNDIHNADLRSVLEVVAGPSIPGGWRYDPVHALTPLLSVSGNFDGLRVYSDPQLGDTRTTGLAKGLRRSLDSLYNKLGLDHTIFSMVDAAITFYEDPLRFFRESGAPCWAAGVCVTSWEGGGRLSSVRMYIQWVVDEETTLIVARDELIHALLAIHVRQKVNLPLWFDQGCSSALSGRGPFDYHIVSRVAAGPNRPSPDDLTRMFLAARLAGTPSHEAYAVSHAVISYIIHAYGMTGLVAILNAMAGGIEFEEAIVQGVGVSFSQLWEDFWRDVPAAKVRARLARAALASAPIFRDVVGNEWIIGFPHHDSASLGRSAVESLANRGAVTAFPDGTFRPQGSLTRAEFAKITAIALAIPQEATLNLVHPSRPITRAEAVVMIIRALGLTPVENAIAYDRVVFADLSAIPGWALEYVREAAVQGIVDYDEWLRFDPQRPITRIEAAIWIYLAGGVKRSLMVRELLDPAGRVHEWTTSATPPPTITPNVNPSSITRGASATLSWGTTDATSISIAPGIGSVALSGNRTVSPTTTTTYVFTATGLGGTAENRVTLTVTDPPPPPPITGIGEINLTAIIDPDGVLLAKATVISVDERARAAIPEGTRALDVAGNPLTTITVRPPVTPAPAPPDKATLAVYEFGPAGATFQPAITIIMEYDPAAIPAGVAETEFILAYYDVATGTWVPLIDVQVNPVANLVSGRTGHFTQFAVLSPIPPRYTLTVTVDPAEGGTVTPSPEPDPDGRYDEGTEVSLTATPAADYEFERWSGDVAGTEPTITLTMDADKSVTAHFIEEVIPDVIPSEVVSVSPKDGARDVTVATSISVTFSEAMDKTAAEGAFTVDPAVEGVFTWENNTLTFDPDAELEYDATYAVTISTAARDLAGNDLVAPYVWSFATEAAPVSLWWVWLIIGLIVVGVVIYLVVIRKKREGAS